MVNKIAFIVGITAVVLYLLGYQQKKSKNIIAFNVISRFIYTSVYAFGIAVPA